MCSFLKIRDSLRSNVCVPTRNMHPKPSMFPNLDKFDDCFDSEYPLKMDNMVPDPSPTLPLTIEEIQQQIDHLEQAHKEKGFPLSGRIIHVCHHLPVEITRVLTPPAPSESGRNSPALSQDGFMSPSLRSGNNFSGGVLPPQRMEEFKEPHSTTVVASDSNWKLASRRGHTAMISGMRSLSSTHEQIVVAWTGDVLQEYAKDNKRQNSTVIPQRPTPRRLQSIAAPKTAPGVETLAEPSLVMGSSPTPPAEVERSLPVDEQVSVYLPELSEEEKKGLLSELDKFSDHEAQKDKAGKLSYAPVFVPREIAKGHYEGYCKTSKYSLTSSDEQMVIERDH
jgi:trehalose 6-phosphate synthase/phosphatase